MDGLAFLEYAATDLSVNLQFGRVGRGSSDDTALRVVNTNSQYSAAEITVTVDSDQLWLSLDGDVFSTTVNVGTLPPNAGSAPFYLRRVTPSDADESYTQATITATPSSWQASVPVLEPADPIIK